MNLHLSRRQWKTFLIHVNEDRNQWPVEFFLDIGLRPGPALRRGEVSWAREMGEGGLTGFDVVLHGEVGEVAVLCALQLLKLVVLNSLQNHHTDPVT